GLGHTPSVCVPEACQDDSRCGRAKRRDELFSQQSQGNRIEQQYALAGERNESTFRREVQQFMDIEVGCAHRVTLYLNESRSYHFDSLFASVDKGMSVSR